jgi:hypothetical protein
MNNNTNLLTESDCQSFVAALNLWANKMEDNFSVRILALAVFCLTLEGHELLVVTVISLLLIGVDSDRLRKSIPVELSGRLRKLTISASEEAHYYKLKDAVTKTRVHAYNIAYLFYTLVLIWNIYRYILGPSLQGLF